MAAVAFRRAVLERDHIPDKPASTPVPVPFRWQARKPLWRLRPGWGAPTAKPRALPAIMLAISHLALYGLFMMGTLASWMLAVPHPGDGSRGASQGALILLSVPVPPSHEAVQPDRPAPVTVSQWVPPPPPMLRVSTIHIQTRPDLPQKQQNASSTAPASHALPPADTGSQGIAGDQVDRRNMDTGRDGTQGGGKVQPASYEAEVLAWINRHKRYPHHAIQARLEGIVGIAVELDNWGRLLRVELLNSSGHRSLDQAALHQVRAAAPYPRPVAADWSRKRIELNLAFSLRDLPAES